MTRAEAIKNAIEERADGIMEKDGDYAFAKNWKTIDYATTCGWTYIVHPITLRNEIRQRNYAEYVEAMNDDLNRADTLSFEDWVDGAAWDGVDVDADSI